MNKLTELSEGFRLNYLMWISQCLFRKKSIHDWTKNLYNTFLDLYIKICIRVSDPDTKIYSKNFEKKLNNLIFFFLISILKSKSLGEQEFGL